MNGDALGTSGRRWRTFLYTYAASMAVVGVFNTINVVTIAHESPDLGLAPPIIWEGSSWLCLGFFMWIPWIGWRLAPPFVRPRWKLLIHLPMALGFAAGHVGSFMLLRIVIYRLAGGHYTTGAPVPQFLYEARKEVLGYLLFIAGFSLVDHLLRQQALIEAPGQTLTFDIRDGARLTRVRLDSILAITSAGNYVEFVMRDARRHLMRSPLSALESELAPRGFLRTHRSWLVNTSHVTALNPEGSGDYAVELGGLVVPLSRRFPEALARLRNTTV
jgi:hypothetical protein